MFDYARIEGGRIVERVQQSDTFGQFRQLYTPALKAAGVVAGALLAGVAGTVLVRAARR